MTGNPLAIASRMVFEMPSARDGSTKTSSPRMTSGTSARAPGIQVSGATPASRQDLLDLRPQRTLTDDQQAHPLTRRRVRSTARTKARASST